MYMMLLLIYAISGIFMLVRNVSALKALNSENKQERLIAIQALKKTFLFVVPSFLLVSAPLLNTFLFSSPDGASNEGGNFSVWLMLAGGLYLLGAFAFEYRIAKSNGTVYKLLGTMYYQIILIVGAYAVIGALDHLRFSGDNTRTMKTELVEKEVFPGVTCGTSFIVINWREGQSEPTEWRCPDNVVLNSDSRQPFVPWPDYTSGESKEITLFLNEAKVNGESTER